MVAVVSFTILIICIRRALSVAVVIHFPFETLMAAVVSLALVGHISHEPRVAIHVVVHLLHAIVGQKHVVRPGDAASLTRLLLSIVIAKVVLHVMVILVLGFIQVAAVAVLKGCKLNLIR